MIRALTQSPLFARLTEAQLERVSARATRLRVTDRQALFEQGDPAERFYLVTQGQIKLYRLSPNGNEKVIEIISAGHTFGEALMFLEHAQYPVGAISLHDSEVISVDAIDFAAMLRESVDTCFMILGGLSQRLHDLVREVSELSLNSASCRVSAYLLSAADTEGLIELQIPKQVLASRLSVTPETFSRIINNLKAHGIIQVSGRRIQVNDLSALAESADVCTLPCKSR